MLTKYLLQMFYIILCHKIFANMCAVLVVRVGSVSFRFIKYNYPNAHIALVTINCFRLCWCWCWYNDDSYVVSVCDYIDVFVSNVGKIGPRNLFISD